MTITFTESDKRNARVAKKKGTLVGIMAYQTTKRIAKSVWSETALFATNVNYVRTMKEADIDYAREAIKRALISNI